MASSDVLLRLAVLMDSSGALKGMDDLSLKADESSKKMAKSYDEATSKLGSSFSSLGQLAGNYGLPVQGVFDGIGKKLDDAKLKGEGFSGAIKSMSGTAALAGAAGVAALAGESIKLASGFDDAKNSLEAAVKASGSSLPKYQSQLDAATQKMAGLGFNSTEVYKALAKGVISTQSASESIGSLGLAADLARTKQISLADATDIVDKAMTGNLRPLKQMGIDLPIAATNALKLQQAHQKVSTATSTLTQFLATHAGAVNTTSKAHAQYETLLGKVKTAQDAAATAASAHDKIIDALSQRLGGQATSYAKTFSGQMATTKANLDNVAISVGSTLLPVVDKLSGWFAKFATFLATHKEFLIGLAIVFGVMLTVATYSWAASLFAVDGALEPLAGTLFAIEAPIWLIVAAIVAVILIGYELYKHWGAVWGFIKQIAIDAWQFIDNNVVQPIASAFTTAFDAVKGVFTDVINWIKQNWGLILGIITGPIGLAIYFITSDWNGIVGFFQGLIKTIGGIFGSIGDTITNAFKNAINLAINAVNVLIRGFDSISGWVSGPHIDTIPEFRAMGGPVSAFNPYIVGEKGPELFVPNTSGSIIPNGGGGAGSTINVYASTNANPSDIATEVGWALRTMAS